VRKIPESEDFGEKIGSEFFFLLTTQELERAKTASQSGGIDL
jgi:hypothetical protein